MKYDTITDRCAVKYNIVLNVYSTSCNEKNYDEKDVDDIYHHLDTCFSQLKH